MENNSNRYQIQKNRIKKFFIISILLITFLLSYIFYLRKSHLETTGKISAKVDYLLPNGYFQTRYKLAICKNDNVKLKNTFHYEEEIDKRYNDWIGIKKIVHENGESSLMKGDILFVRRTSEGDYIIQTTDETFSGGVIDEKTFDENFSFDEEYMRENANYAYAKQNLIFYDKNKNEIDINDERTKFFKDDEPIMLGNIVNREGDFVEVRLYPGEEETIWIKKEDLKFSPCPSFMNDNSFTL